MDSLNTFQSWGNFIVNGTVTMNGGDISFQNTDWDYTGKQCSITGIREQITVAADNALFYYGIESFSHGSTLIIKKLYNYAVPWPSLLPEISETSNCKLQRNKHSRMERTTDFHHTR